MLKRTQNTETNVISSDPDIFSGLYREQANEMLKRTPNTETNVISSDPDIFRDGIENRLMKCLK